MAAADAHYSFLDSHCSSAGNCCSPNVGLTVAPQRARGQFSYPPAGENGTTVDRSSNRVGAGGLPRPATLVSGIIGGIALGAPAGPAGMTLASGVTGDELVGAAEAAQVDGTESGPTEVEWPSPAETAGAPPPKPVEASTLTPAPAPADCTAPSSLAAVLTARAAFAVLPVVKSRESMLIGIVAIRNGVLRLLSIDNDDADDEDDVDEVSVAVDVRLATLCGDARLARLCCIPEISCGPEDINVSTSVVPEVPTACTDAAACPMDPAGLVVCGGLANGVDCTAVAAAPA